VKDRLMRRSRFSLLDMQSNVPPPLRRILVHATVRTCVYPRYLTGLMCRRNPSLASA
jgi:hypothetical protein